MQRTAAWRVGLAACALQVGVLLHLAGRIAFASSASGARDRIDLVAQGVTVPTAAVVLAGVVLAALVDDGVEARTRPAATALRSGVLLGVLVAIAALVGTVEVLLRVNEPSTPIAAFRIGTALQRGGAAVVGAAAAWFGGRALVEEP